MGSTANKTENVRRHPPMDRETRAHPKTGRTKPGDHRTSLCLWPQQPHPGRSATITPSTTRRIMGIPFTGASTLPGNLEELIRAWIKTMTCIWKYVYLFEHSVSEFSHKIILLSTQKGLYSRDHLILLFKGHFRIKWQCQGLAACCFCIRKIFLPVTEFPTGHGQMRRQRIIYFGFNPHLLQMGLQLIAFISPDDIQMIDMSVPGTFPRQTQP